MLISITISVRRLHDIGRSGAWVLGILLLPGLGTVFWLILGCLTGEEHDNRYGPDPYGDKRAQAAA